MVCSNAPPSVNSSHHNIHLFISHAHAWLSISTLSLCKLQFVLCLIGLGLVNLGRLLQTLLDNAGQDLVGYLGSSQSCLFAPPIVARRDFNYIGTDDIQTLDSPQNADELSGRPATRLRGASTRGLEQYPLARQVIKQTKRIVDLQKRDPRHQYPR